MKYGLSKKQRKNQRTVNREKSEAYQTIGGMFKDVKQDIIEHKLNERFIAVISEILIVLDFIIDGLDLEETLSKLIHHSKKITFLMNIENNK